MEKKCKEQRKILGSTCMWMDIPEELKGQKMLTSGD